MLVSCKYISKVACLIDNLSCLFTFHENWVNSFTRDMYNWVKHYYPKGPLGPPFELAFFTLDCLVCSLFGKNKPVLLGNRGISCELKQTIAHQYTVEQCNPLLDTPPQPFQKLGIHYQQGQKRMLQKIYVKLCMLFLLWRSCSIPNTYNIEGK